MDKRAFLVLRRQSFVFIFAEEFDVTAERYDRQQIFRFTDLTPENLRPEAE